jgi:ankyrin repeat protein
VTPLLVAAGLGHEAVVRALVQAGADTNAPDQVNLLKIIIRRFWRKEVYSRNALLLLVRFHEERR